VFIVSSSLVRRSATERVVPIGDGVGGLDGDDCALRVDAYVELLRVVLGMSDLTLVYGMGPRRGGVGFRVGGVMGGRG